MLHANQHLHVYLLAVLNTVFSRCSIQLLQAIRPMTALACITLWLGEDSWGDILHVFTSCNQRLYWHKKLLLAGEHSVYHRTRYFLVDVTVAKPHTRVKII